MQLVPCGHGDSHHWAYREDAGRHVWLPPRQEQGLCLEMVLSAGVTSRRPLGLAECKPITAWGDKNQDWQQMR